MKSQNLARHLNKNRFIKMLINPLQICPAVLFNSIHFEVPSVAAAQQSNTIPSLLCSHPLYFVKGWSSSIPLIHSASYGATMAS